ncbi:Myb-like domain [Ceraceosorus bombacis]|uniref:Myb-like domain n=1 Tax=Ceraceosorus bombacis TaxID=401625 RepID=A0A0N7L973_9BASI|nr:Myb-like domain [Ceraceosorus bombacis]
MKSGPGDVLKQEEEDVMDSSAPEDNCFEQEKLINQSTKSKSKKRARASASPKKMAAPSSEDEEMDEAQCASPLASSRRTAKGTPKRTSSARLSTGQTSPKKKHVPKEEVDEETNGANSPNKKRPQTGQAASVWTAEQRKDMVMSMCDLGYPAMDWAAIGERCGGRTGVQARDYWRKVMKPKLANMLEQS